MRPQAGEVASVIRIIRVGLFKEVAFEQGPTPGEKGSHRDIKIWDASQICVI